MTKVKQTNELTAKMLAPLIKYCETTEGGMMRLVKLYNKGLTKPIHYGTIHRWLTKKGPKTFEPHAGSFLRLCECYQKIRGQDVEGKPMPSIWCVVNGHCPNHEGRECKVCKCAL